MNRNNNKMIKKIRLNFTHVNIRYLDQANHLSVTGSSLSLGASFQCSSTFLGSICSMGGKKTPRLIKSISWSRPMLIKLMKRFLLEELQSLLLLCDASTNRKSAWSHDRLTVHWWFTTMELQSCKLEAHYYMLVFLQNQAMLKKKIVFRNMKNCLY